MLTFIQWLTEGMGTLKAVIGKDSMSQLRTHLRDVMPKGKVQHSLRVGSSAARIGLDAHTVNAAILHDFIERGGNLNVLVDHLGLSPKTVAVIRYLSSEEKNVGESGGNEPLEHIRQVLASPTMDADTSNVVILIKIADRLDNLKKRVNAGGVGKGYLQKSKDLITFLFQSYTGDAKPILILRKRLKNLGLSIKKYHLAGIDLS